MELFVILVNAFQTLKNITKSFISDVGGILKTPLLIFDTLCYFGFQGSRRNYSKTLENESVKRRQI